MNVEPVGIDLEALEAQWLAQAEAEAEYAASIMDIDESGEGSW